MKIQNTKLYKHHWHLVLAGVTLFVAVYSLSDQNFPFGILLILNTAFQIRAHFQLKDTQIEAIILDAKSIKIVHGNNLCETVSIDQIIEIPMNSRCARIDYSENDHPKSLLLRDVEFTPDAWSEVQTEFKRVCAILADAKTKPKRAGGEL